MWSAFQLHVQKGQNFIDDLDELVSMSSKMDLQVNRPARELRHVLACEETDDSPMGAIGEDDEAGVTMQF